jgi:hypothetical protein
VGDREILETYLNSVSKNTSQTDIIPHGTKFLLTSVIGQRPTIIFSKVTHNNNPKYCLLSEE